MRVFRALHWTTLGLVLLWGAWGAWDLRWICDDAFISFRYAQNLVDGLGLVFNAGERVEGYTNFLWTLYIAAGMALGLSPEPLSLLGGLTAYAATTLMLLRSGLRMGRELGLAVTGLPLAALGWTAHLHARIYGTSGLETAAFTALACATCLAAIEGRGPRRVALWGTLAALTRPEGALFYALAAGSLRIGGSWRSVIRALAPGAAAAGLYAGWKLWYYGDLLPNTFYAKSGHLSWWSQGWLYLEIYLRTYWPLAAAGLALAGMAARDAAGLARGGEARRGWASPRASLLLAAAAGGFLLHVAKVGGDFMFARFCLPATPLLLLGLELVGHRVGGGALRPLLAAGTAAAFLLAPWPDWASEAGGWGFNEERSFYLPGTAEEAARQGAILRAATEGLGATVAIQGSQAMLAYYAEFPTVIEAHAGLTDAWIARQPLAERGRPGHEKAAPLSYLRERGVRLTFDYALRDPGDPGYRGIDFGDGVTGRIFTYERSLMSALAARGARFQDFEALLDAYIEGAASLPPAQIRSDLDAFQSYYFDHNRDPSRRSRLEALASGDGGPGAPSE